MNVAFEPLTSGVDRTGGVKGQGGVLLALAFIALLGLVRPGPLAGQSGALERVDTHATEGRFEEARADLESWWDRERAGASRDDLQRALWLRGILTLDPELAEIDYQRLVLEFPGGPYSDDALLRLAQGAHAADDLAGASGYFRQLVRDYPGSPLRSDARDWLSRLDDSGASVTPPPSVEREQSRPGERAEQRPPPESGSDPEQRPFAVQLGAFQDEEGARRLAEELSGAGLVVRLVRVGGSDLIRVRTGGFADREGVAPLLERIRSLGFDGFLVSDGREEVRIR